MPLNLMDLKYRKVALLDLFHHQVFITITLLNIFVTNNLQVQLIYRHRLHSLHFRFLCLLWHPHPCHPQIYPP